MTTATKIGFANAVRKYGDVWRVEFYGHQSQESKEAETKARAIGDNSLTEATSDWRDFERMNMCERYGRYWQKGIGA